VDWWQFGDLVVFQGTLACYFMTHFFRKHEMLVPTYNPFGPLAYWGYFFHG